MTTYFPADVSIRIQGDDLQGAQRLMAPAANLLFKALERQRLGGITNVDMQSPVGQDGSQVRVKLAGSLKQVFVTPGSGQGGAFQETLPEIPLVLRTLLLYPMYSGVVKPKDVLSGSPTVVSIINPDPPPANVPALEQYHPDDTTARAYSINDEWQTIPKLGVNDAGVKGLGTASSAFPKPGMFTGAMKRVVQALYGLGNVETDTIGYISEEYPDSYPELAVWCQYEHAWLRTHGIHKSDDGSVWLIEISKLNGVLAMPLPIFNQTDTSEYRAIISGYGDEDTLNILDEFGGMPSGEAFPTAGALADAITAGKVLVLKTPEAIAEFYHDSTFIRDKTGAWNDQCWAFSESGRFADNLCFWYKDPSIATPTYPYVDIGAVLAAPADLRFQWVDHYRIVFELSAIPTPTAVGSGVATFVRVKGGQLQETFEVGYSASPELYSASVFLTPTGDSDFLQPYTFFGFPNGSESFNDQTTVHLFYDGERLEEVRFASNLGGSFSIGSFYGDSLSYGIPTQPTINAVCLIVPNFCRESYVLMYGQPAGHGFGDTYPVEQRGYFAQLGIVEFPTMIDPVYSTIDFGIVYSEISWLCKWCGYAHIGVTYGSLYMHFGAVINAGPSRSAVMNHGVFVSANSDLYMPFTRAQETQYDQIGVGHYTIDTDTTAASITFVGSP